MKTSSIPCSLLLFLLAVGVPLSGLSACGTDNVFEPLVKKDDKDKAENALRDGDYDAAIDSLEEHLRENPGDTEARSMLANAYMKKAGINEIKLAADIAGGDGGDWKGIVSAMPAGTSANVSNLKSAVETLSAIPASQRSAEQSYQLALAQASLAVTITKKTAGDGGSVSDAKVDAMSDADALTVYETLKDSQETVSSSSSLAQNAGAQKLADLPGKIAAAEGESDAEKMRNFLKSNN